MNIYASSSIVSAIIGIFLGWFIYLKGPKSLKNQLFALLTLFAAVWSFSPLIVNIAKTETEALFWIRLVGVGAFFIPSLFLHFSFVVLESNKRKKERFLVLTAYAISLILLFFNFTPLHIEKVIISKPYFLLNPGPAYPIFVVLFGTMFIYSLALMATAYKHAEGIKKHHYLYIITAIAIAVSGGILHFSVAYTRVEPIPHDFLVIVFVSLISYAIVKHRLMDIRLLVLKSVVYALTFGLIAAGYVSLTVFVFQRLESTVNTTVLNIGTLFILVFTFQPLKRFIEKNTDKLFSKGHYKFRDLISKINDISIKNSRSVGAVTIKVLKALLEDMRLDKNAIVLTLNSEISEIKALGFKTKSKNFWNKSTKIALDKKELVVYDELPEDSKEREVLRKAGVQVMMPVKSGGQMEGILMFGNKKSGDMYTAEDLKLIELITPQLALALENAKSFNDKEQRIAELKAINDMFQNIEHFVSLDTLLQEVVDEAIRVTGAEGGSLMLINKNGKKLSIKTARNLHPLISLETKIKVGEGIAGHVAKTQEPLVLNGLRDPEFKESLKREDIVSAISVPMKAGDELIGVLNVNRKKVRVEFTEENLNVMNAFASQAAEAIEKAGYYQKIERLSITNDNQFKEFTKALAKTVDAKDPYTYGHSEAVTNYTLQIAEEMGFNEEKLRLLEIGGRLHDMGKIGVAEHILNKPGGLTDEEFKEIQRHPEIGARILQDTSSLKGIRDLILYHHERFDGKGYPTRLKGKDIPLGARIMAVADTFDAMTSHRAYRKALPRKVAVAEIKNCSGTQFDPEIVDVFLKVLEKKRFHLIKNTRHQASYRQKPDMMETDEK